jgi:isopentenyl diphosphate isomerase/L-lactate dehydrogenase-like FMN-dependent dehydrogenase
VDRLREIWPGKLIIKGILHADDARQALAHGVDGLVVSNHGGRNLDSADATLDVLPEIVAAVGGKTTVIVDSGIRRGSDIVKCIALGADLVLSGRATLYGTAVAGQAGAEKALAILKDEMRRTMAYLGKQRVSELGSEIFSNTR